MSQCEGIGPWHCNRDVIWVTNTSMVLVAQSKHTFRNTSLENGSTLHMDKTLKIESQVKKKKSTKSSGFALLAHITTFVAFNLKL